MVVSCTEMRAHKFVLVAPRLPRYGGHAGLGSLAHRPGPNRAGALWAWDLLGLGRLAPVCHSRPDAYASGASIPKRQSHPIQIMNIMAIAAAAVGAG